MEFPTLINWTSPFTFEGLSGCIFFHFYSNFNRTLCKQTVENLIAASDLVLHCLPMSHQKDARLTQRYVKVVYLTAKRIQIKPYTIEAHISLD